MKLKIASIILTLAMIGLFTTQALAQKKEFRKGKHFSMMMEKLNLTSEQKDKMAAARLEHQKQMVDLKADLKKKEISLKELRLNEIDREEVLNAVKEINNAKNEIAFARANNMMDFYEILTPEQKKIWRENEGHFIGFDHFGRRGRKHMKDPNYCDGFGPKKRR